METGQTILTRGLPKTGQTVVRATGDDGTHQAGWWQRLKIADNRERFIVKTLDGDDVAIDLATGLMWPTAGDAAGCNNDTELAWAAAIAYANGLTFATFSDWRIPNINELLSILKYTAISPIIDTTVFTATATEYYWTSTTTADSASYAWVVLFAEGNTYWEAKINSNFLRCVRGGM